MNPRWFPYTALRNSATKQAWYEIRAQEQQAEIFIFDEIGVFGVSAQSFVQELKGLQGKSLKVRVNSPGGDVFDGLAIHSALVQHDAPVETVVDGLAASAAAIVTMAGKTVTMAENAFLMIHDAWGMVLGNAREMREFADLLDKVSGQVAQLFAKKTGLEFDDVRGLMEKETWMSAAEAVDKGFADGVMEDGQSASNQNRAKLAMFDHAPLDNGSIATASITASLVSPITFDEPRQDAALAHMRRRLELASRS